MTVWLQKIKSVSYNAKIAEQITESVILDYDELLKEGMEKQKQVKT